MDDLNAQLLQAAKDGNARQVEALLQAGAEPFYQETERGSSVLMHAASSGNVEAVTLLLNAGAPWNALDRVGRCAGDYAIEGGHQEVINKLVDHAVIVEQLLGKIERRTLKEERKAFDGNLADSSEYLGRHVRYEGDKLLDDADDGVMMEWERPLMRAHAEVLCGPNKDRDVLNVGFGMGIVDTFIQEFGCRSHTIIEAHPDVHRKMIENGWDKKPGVRIAFGRWQDVIHDLGQFDAIFYDTYAEHYTDMQDFHDLLPDILRSGGIYSFFNGLAPKNVFFHAVACQTVQLELQRLQFEVEFETIDIDVDDKTWEGVRRKYWHDRKQYFLPIATYCQEVDMECDGKQSSGDHSTLDLGGTPPCKPQEVLEDSNAEELVLAEAEGGDGTCFQVQLHARLDPQHGGLKWIPSTQSQGCDLATVNMLRLWFPPMLHDEHRNAIYEKAINEAVKWFIASHGHAPVVLDIGTGTGLLSLLAVRAGAKHVYACEGFQALAHIATAVIAQAKCNDRITVIPKRSTDVEVGVDIPQKCDMVVSEILDSSLIGERILPSLRDARQRLLVSEAPSIPAAATVFGRLIQSGILCQMHHLPAKGSSLIFPSCTGGRSLVTMHYEGLHDAAYLSEPVSLFSLDFSCPSSSEIRRYQGSFKAVRAGHVDGVLLYWTLDVWPGVDQYSTAPDTGYWQDHWHQMIWPLASQLSSIEVQEGTTIVLNVFHDDTQIWVDFLENEGNSPSCQKPCTCGPHALLSPQRILTINHDLSSSSFSRILKELPAQALAGTVLDICDGSIFGLLLAKEYPCAQVVGLQPKEGHRSCSKLLAEFNALHNFSIWSGPGPETWNAVWGKVSLIIGDCFYQQLQNRPLWNILNFWYLRSALHPLLKANFTVVPRKAKLVAALVHFSKLADCHRPVTSVCGFDHTAFATAQQMTTGEDADIPLWLWEYDYTLLTEPIVLLDLDFQNPIAHETKGGCLLENVCCTPVTKSGCAQAVLMWVHVELDATDTPLICSLQPGPGRTKQTVRWLPEYTFVEAAQHYLKASVQLDLITSTNAFSFQIEAPSPTE